MAKQLLQRANVKPPAPSKPAAIVDLGERQSAASIARNVSPIVPRGQIAGRALIAVVAIMTFLASVTTGAVLLVAASASAWQSDVASEITVQLRPRPGRDLERDTAAAAAAVRAQPGIVDARPYTKDESAALLEPWLGGGLSLNDLPVPRVIVARVAPSMALDLSALRARLADVAPSASIDDHRAWIARMRIMTGATVLAGLGVLALMMMATIICVVFATRGAMSANRAIVEVLHFVGASDRFIAARFQRHFLVLGLQGALIGCAIAMLSFGFSESVAAWFSGTPVGDQFAALLGTFSLRSSAYGILGLQALAIAGVTALASRRTLFATLHEID